MPVAVRVLAVERLNDTPAQTLSAPEIVAPKVGMPVHACAKDVFVLIKNKHPIMRSAFIERIDFKKKGNFFIMIFSCLIKFIFS